MKRNSEEKINKISNIRRELASQARLFAFGERTRFACSVPCRGRPNIKIGPSGTFLYLVIPAGVEPAIFWMRTRRPGPLDDGTKRHDTPKAIMAGGERNEYMFHRTFTSYLYYSILCSKNQYFHTPAPLLRRFALVLARVLPRLRHKISADPPPNLCAKSPRWPLHSGRYTLPPSPSW